MNKYLFHDFGTGYEITMFVSDELPTLFITGNGKNLSVRIFEIQKMTFNETTFTIDFGDSYFECDRTTLTDDELKQFIKEVKDAKKRPIKKMNITLFVVSPQKNQEESSEESEDGPEQSRVDDNAEEPDVNQICTSAVEEEREYSNHLKEELLEEKESELILPNDDLPKYNDDTENKKEESYFRNIDQENNYDEYEELESSELTPNSEAKEEPDNTPLASTPTPAPTPKKSHKILYGLGIIGLTLLILILIVMIIQLTAPSLLEPFLSHVRAAHISL